MTTLSVTAKGQVTLRKEVLQHLGLKPGDKIELDLLPDGQGLIRKLQQQGSMEGFVGLLAGKSPKRATLEEIADAATQSWGQGDQ